MQCDTIQCSTVQYSAVPCSAVQQYSTVQYSVLQYNAVQYSIVQCNTVQYSSVRYSVVQCSIAKSSPVQCGTVQNHYSNSTIYKVLITIFKHLLQLSSHTLLLCTKRKHISLICLFISDCGSNPADIVFLLDASGSVGTTNFQKQKDFVSKFVQAFNIGHGPQDVQIGAVTWSSAVHNQFNMNKYGTKTALQSAINGITYDSGNTQTHLALQYVMNNSFKPAAGDRPNVPNILIVMTDGQSTTPSQTLTETQKLHHIPNLKVFAIGIGSGVDRTELGHIASDSKHVFVVNSFDALTTIQTELKKKACKGNMSLDAIKPTSFVCSDQ